MNRSHPLRSRAVLSALVAMLAACSANQSRSEDSAVADTAPALSPAFDSVRPLPPAPAAASPGTPPDSRSPGATPAASAPGRRMPSPSSPGTSQRSDADTVRGTVAVVGSFPVTSVVVRPAGGRDVTVTGPLASEIRRAAGADVWISGMRSAEGIEASRYVVRTVDGDAVVDGTVALEGDRVVLVTAQGRRTIARPPQALRQMAGARVWLVGPLDGTIASYGVLREP